jgi:hypothetical protein
VRNPAALLTADEKERGSGEHDAPAEKAPAAKRKSTRGKKKK